LLLFAVLLVGLLAMGLNMFNYPAFTWTEDEGVYVSQAWAVLRTGQLAPYTYVYDHAPGGWLLLAAWMGFTGQPLAFGNTIDSGRVLMLLLHLAMVPLLYHLARKLGCRAPLAALAAGLFSVSPLAVTYQRLVLLDSMMLFWVLLSLDLLLDGWGRLSRVIMSGFCFGVALVTKETAAVLLPVMIFIAVHQRRRSPW
jgi:4-amino-4-deoxy-L-arabinose transferase-like glycosyltransferase